MNVTGIKLIQVGQTWVFDGLKCIGLIRALDHRAHHWLVAGFDEAGQLHELGFAKHRNRAIETLQEWENKKCNTTPK